MERCLGSGSWGRVPAVGQGSLCPSAAGGPQLSCRRDVFQRDYFCSLIWERDPRRGFIWRGTVEVEPRIRTWGISSLAAGAASASRQTGWNTCKKVIIKAHLSLRVLRASFRNMRLIRRGVLRASCKGWNFNYQRRGEHFLRERASARSHVRPFPL